MYVVQAIEKSSEYPEVQPVYEFAGEEEEITRFKRNVGSLVLAAINNGSAHVEDGYALIRSLQYRDDIHAFFKQLFESVIEDAVDLVNLRGRLLTRSASEGLISMSHLWQELDDLNEFYPKGMEDLTWLTRDGLAAHLDEGKLNTRINDDLAGIFGDSSLEVKTAQELELNAESAQHELVRDKTGRPRLLSDHEHSTLGRLDDQGNFEAVVTVLSKEHPLRSNQE